MTLYRAGGEEGGKQEMGRLGEAHSFGEQAQGEGRGADVKRTLGIRPQSWRGGSSMVQDVGLGGRALARPRRLI